MAGHIRSGAARRRFTWNAFLWSLVYPRGANRVVPTIPGLVLIGLSLGIGMAAYNSSSNILFLTLSLLLTCLVVSGIMSSLNLRGVRWHLSVAPALRVGHDTSVGIELHNTKGFLATYGLWFRMAARPVAGAGQYRAESTLTARSGEIRAALARAEAAEVRGTIALAGRLDAGAAARLEWIFQPARRGIVRIELESVGSLFPFGFLRKEIGTDVAAEVVVWPAPIEYRRHAALAPRRLAGDERVLRAGSGSDLIAVRRYATGDSHRLIHWKASARTRQLLVRQFAAETSEGYVLALDTDAQTWARAEQFEVLVSFAATLAEDLFRAGRLLAVAVDDDAPSPIRSLKDLELFLNRLAIVQPAPVADGSRRRATPRQNLLQFAPDGARGVLAHVSGQPLASA